MKFILKTSCTDEFYDGHEYALVEIKPEDASALMRQKQIFESAHEQAKDLVGMLFYSADANYFSTYPDEFEDLVQSLYEPFTNETGWIQVPDSFVLPDNYLERSKGDRLFVDKDGVYWLCQSGEVEIETARLPYSEIARAALEIPEVQKA